MESALGQTLYDKLWDEHAVRVDPDGTTLLYVDLHLVNDVTSPQAFEGLRAAGRRVWRSVSTACNTGSSRSDDGPRTRH